MANIKQNPDGSLGIINDIEGLEVFRVGGANPASGGATSGSPSAVITTANSRGKQTLKLPIFNGTASITASMGLWVNNLDGPILVGAATVLIGVGGSTTFNISVGTGTMSSNLEFKGSCNNLIDAANYNTIDTNNTVFNNIDDKGSAGKSRQRLAVGDAIGVFCNRNLLTAQITLYVDYTKI